MESDGKVFFFTFWSKVHCRNQSRYTLVWDATQGEHLPLRCARSYYTPPHWPKTDGSLVNQVGIFGKLNMLSSSLQALIAISWLSQRKWMLLWKICSAGSPWGESEFLNIFRATWFFFFFGRRMHAMMIPTHLWGFHQYFPKEKF